MKRKLLAVSVAVLLIATSLCGCADVDGNVTSSNLENNLGQTSGLASAPIEESSNVTIPNGGTGQTSDGISSIPTKGKIYKQKRKQFSEEQLISLFSDTPQKVERGYDNEIYYETDTEMGYIDNGSNFGFYTPAGSTYGSICASSFLELNGVEGYEDGAHDFATREEILAQVKDLLWDKFGIPQEDWYTREFYAVKKETVESYKEAVFQQANVPVTSSNEYEQDKWAALAEELKNIPGKDYYYISLGFNIDGNPYYSGGGFYYGQEESSLIMGYIADFVYTENGIENIVLVNINETDMLSAQEADVISPDEAKVLIQQKYDSIIFDGEIDIYDMQFVYLPIPQNDLGEYHLNFEARPFYAFYCKLTENYNGEQITSNEISYFDAVTGKEFGSEPIY